MIEPATSITDIFTTRAKKLSEPIGDGERALEFCVFVLGGQRFACENRWLREFIEVRTCLLVPGAPLWLQGLINLRGRVIALADIRPILDLPLMPVAGRRLAIVLHHSTLAMAIVVESLEGMQAFAPEGPSTEQVRKTADDAVLHRFVMRQEICQGGLVTVLDIERLLSDDALIINQV